MCLTEMRLSSHPTVKAKVSIGQDRWREVTNLLLQSFRNGGVDVDTMQNCVIECILSIFLISVLPSIRWVCVCVRWGWYACCWCWICSRQTFTFLFLTKKTWAHFRQFPEMRKASKMLQKYRNPNHLSLLSKNKPWCKPLSITVNTVPPQPLQQQPLQQRRWQ